MREGESSTGKPMSPPRSFQGTEWVIVNLEPDALLKTSPKIQTERSAPTAPRGAIRVARLYLESVTAQTGASPPRLLRQYQAASHVPLGPVPATPDIMGVPDSMGRRHSCRRW